MRSSYKKLGPYIREVKVKNSNLEVEKLLGVSITKEFIPSIANTIGTDMSEYKIVRTNQFAYGPVTSRNGDKISVALLQEDDCIISTSYTVFEIIDTEELLPEYLMMWFRRPEFDRYARYMSHGSVREIFGWGEICDVELPVPSIEKQREIVKEYQTITDRIKLNEQLNQKLEETAQAIYKQWFVDFEFPISKEYALEIGKLELEGKPYKSSGSEMIWNRDLDQEIPKGWSIVPLSKICSKIGSGATPKGGNSSYRMSGITLIRSLNVHDYNFRFKDLAFISEAQATKLDNVQVEARDVLLNITGVSVARCCRVPQNVLPARVNQHVSIVRLKSEINSSCYLLCTLCSSNSKSRLLGTSNAGSTRQAITKSDIEDFEIVLPEATIRADFESIIDDVFTFKESLNMQNEKLSAIQELLLMRVATS